ncbi:MAG: iron-sulfur cluster loop [Gammaproteobacteria bacterium]|nr:iron-sulfur cluster loop [Gammaproteobacteria bacterium]
MNKRREKAIVAALLRFEKSLHNCKTDFLLKCGSEEHKLITDIEKHPHAFVIGCVLDRVIKAEKAWAAPYKLKQRIEQIGVFSFSHLGKLTPDDWEKYLGRQDDDPEFLHINWRNVKQGMPLCLHSAMQVINRYSKGDGDARHMWTGDNLRGKDIVARFKEIRGVGDKIANMAVRILVTRFKQPIETASIDISVDRHIARVVRRLGLIGKNTPKSQEKKVIVDKARELYPKFPAFIDLPIFIIGRNFCHETNPNCGGCPMSTLCDYALHKRKPAPKTKTKRKRMKK